jgi:bifunctional non-homologous end joining protein LigD
VIIGYTKGEGNRENYFGSLLLAAYYNNYNNSKKLRFVGHTGSGFDLGQLNEIYSKLKQMRIEKCPIDYIPYTNRNPVWIEPKLVVEVKFNDWTEEKIMRAPIFLGFREDKTTTECIIEEEKSTEKIVLPSSSSNGNKNNEEKEYRQHQDWFTFSETSKEILSSNGHSNNTSSSSSSFSNLDKVF